MALFEKEPDEFAAHLIAVGEFGDFVDARRRIDLLKVKPGRTYGRL